MEEQIKTSLITLGKIASFTSTTRINTLDGDCDEYVDGTYAAVRRAVWDSRSAAQQMLIKKYNQVKELIRFIMESNNETMRNYLPKIRRNLEASKGGLSAYKSNELYVADKKIQATVNHLLNDEIPGQIAVIDHYRVEDAVSSAKK
jgi:hypothetical protein